MKKYGQVSHRFWIGAARALSSSKQARVLARYGIPAEKLAIAQASGLIQGLISQKVKPSPGWVDRARAWAGQIARAG